MFKLGVALVLVAEVVGLLLLSLVVESFPLWILVPIVPRTVAIALVVRNRSGMTAHARGRISPGTIVGYRPRRRAESRGGLSRSIVERAAETRRSLTERPADETRVEMC